MATRILLLEDDNFCRGLLETVLISEGYDVVVCDSPSDVAERSRHDPTALALVDFWGRSQLVLTPDDRAQLVQLAAEVPTVLVTARSWAEKCAAADLGLLAIIIKPFGLTELYEIVAVCAARLNDRASSAEQSDTAGVPA